MKECWGLNHIIFNFQGEINKKKKKKKKKQKKAKKING